MAVRERKTSDRSRGSSPLSRNNSPARGGGDVISSGAPLVGDARLSQTRMIITKTHVSYPVLSSLIPFPSAVLGFHVVFHTPAASSSSRVHNADLHLTFRPPADLPSSSAPIIKSLYPSSSTFGSPDTKVTYRVDRTMGISFGYSPYGSLQVGKTGTRSISTTTNVSFEASGLETTDLMLTLKEDPTTKAGVPSSFDFAILLYLPSGTQTKEFSCEFDIDATIGTLLTRIFSSAEKTYVLDFDGHTELGKLELGGIVQTKRNVIQAPTLGRGNSIRLLPGESSVGLQVEEVASNYGDGEQGDVEEVDAGGGKYGNIIDNGRRR